MMDWLQLRKLGKNFWIKLTHCEDKSWKKLCPSFLNCKSSTILQHFFHKMLGRIFFPQLVSAGIYFQNHPPPSNQKLDGRPLKFISRNHFGMASGPLPNQQLFSFTASPQGYTSVLRPGQTRMRVDESWQSCNLV